MSILAVGKRTDDFRDAFRRQARVTFVSFVFLYRLNHVLQVVEERVYGPPQLAG